MTSRDPRRRLPGVDRLLGEAGIAGLVEAGIPRRVVVAAIQEVLDGMRAKLASGDGAPAGCDDPAWYPPLVTQAVERRTRRSLRPVINATGVVLHTNLGRAPLSEAAVAAVAGAARGYGNLEFDLDRGERGSRYDHCAGLLAELTGAEAALVVNNNAAAVVLALNTLAAGKEAVISRGELVEIGGAFRVPEIMAASGARMVEVGATNRTHAADYAAALGPETAAILKVHRSNFRMSGFTSEVGVAELAALGSARGVPVLHDLGSGLLLDPDALGLPADEPTAMHALRAGAAVVTMSGDKLLGGPQAGIILGGRDLVDRMRRNPLCRAVRVDKLTLAALEATLAAYRDPVRAAAELPALRMLAAEPHALAARAEALAGRLRAAGVDASTAEGASAVGGGAYPDVALPTTLVRVRVGGIGADRLEARLRANDPPILARIVDARVAIDPRTLAPEEENAVVAALAGTRAGADPEPAS